ncbi:Sensory transduction protein LytR [Dyadobacter sp. CECT 9275]|jgi:two-component system, LytTR family, response regulator LytT|uniref:Sensory transduction protein LytR n=1 Tax=Dyadobacter helix TaxID=2822344 RepID=A0A916JHW3_9BACT|nr:LytTR family DNA-binding domain-containing protein [Dyadobacter sp. CECT 9275]CAG5015990.1 Sensory transduction protein LytR [Dyadobacter sp. CECT 9275]
MKILILEDESLSAQRASQLLAEYDPEIEILEVLDSIEEAVIWLNEHPEPDLMLLDIHLADGLCFDLFEQVSVRSPVIFTTAYDQYALQAFKINSIDYLLKPLDKKELCRAMDKYHSLLQDRRILSVTDVEQLRSTMEQLTKKYKGRFLVRYADAIYFKNVEDVAYFYADDKVVFMVTTDGKKYLMESNLESLEEVLDPAVFFRINRKIIARIESIQKIKTLLSSRLQVFLSPAFSQDVYVSKYKSQEFKNWLDN